jgi:hypothetical protein
LVDDHSELAYSEVLTDGKGPTCAGFLARAAAFFAAHGITRLERVMTDNAWAYKRSLRGIIGDRNTYTSIDLPGRKKGCTQKWRGFLTG